MLIRDTVCPPPCPPVSGEQTAPFECVKYLIHLDLSLWLHVGLRSPVIVLILTAELIPQTKGAPGVGEPS